uniref:Uncharacterized protein n=1 Tax=Arundo donax TaxID=35708 RepID=A0A0A9FD85_ARUDO
MFLYSVSTTVSSSNHPIHVFNRV